MTYTKQTWVNDSGGGTPLSATRLNYMEDGIYNADVAATAAQTTANTANTNANTAATDANAAQVDAFAAVATANAAVPLSTVTTVGDLIVGAGSGAVTRLAAEADERLLQADSTDPKGVIWGRKITVSSTMPVGPRVGDLWLQVP